MKTWQIIVLLAIGLAIYLFEITNDGPWFWDNDGILWIAIGLMAALGKRFLITHPEN